MDSGVLVIGSRFTLWVWNPKKKIKIIEVHIFLHIIFLPDVSKPDVCNQLLWDVSDDTTIASPSDCAFKSRIIQQYCMYLL